MCKLIYTYTLIFFLSVFKRFKELDPKNVPKIMTGDEAQTIQVPMEKILKMQELKVGLSSD